MRYAGIIDKYSSIPTVGGLCSLPLDAGNARAHEAAMNLSVSLDTHY